MNCFSAAAAASFNKGAEYEKRGWEIRFGDLFFYEFRPLIGYGQIFLFFYDQSFLERILYQSCRFLNIESFFYLGPMGFYGFYTHR